MIRLATAFLTSAALAAVALPALTGPAAALDSQDLVVACVKATGVQGEYDFAPAVWPPRVRALEGGTPGGAARINACIRDSHDPFAPAYGMMIAPDADPALKGRIAVAVANELNAESAPCQLNMVGGAGYNTCHRPW